MAYGTVKVDNVTFTYNAADATTTFSGFYASTTNNLTLSGTASAATFTGTTANFTNVNAQNISVTTALSGLAITGGTAGFTTVTGTTVTGTTANFVSGVFSTQVSGVTITGTTVAATTGDFTSLTGTTTTGTTANFASGVFTTQVSGVTVIATTGTFTSLTGTTTTGTTANFVSGVFTTQISGVTITGTTVSTTTGNFISLTGTTATITSGIIASGTAALPSLAILSDLNTGIYSPGEDQLAISTNGTEKLIVKSDGKVGIGTSTFATNSKFAVQTGAGKLDICGDGASSVKIINGGGITFDSASGHYFHNGATELMRITAAGLVGIGTTSPSQALHVVGDQLIAGATAGTLIIDGVTRGGLISIRNNNVQTAVIGNLGAILGNSNSGLALLSEAGNEIRFFTNGSGTPRVIVDTSGRLLVGTSTAQGVSKLQVQGTTADSTEWGGLFLRRGLAAASISSGFYLGQIDFGNQDGGVAAFIRAEGDAQWGTDDYPGRLVFSTTADAASSPTERMRIHNDGRISTGTTSAPGAALFGFSINRTGSQGLLECYRNVGNNSQTAIIGGNAGEAYIEGDGDLKNTNNSYGAISDQKLKENIVDASSQWVDIKALQVRRYNFKEETGYNTHTQIGLVAQEVELVSPGLVNESPDRDTEGNDLGTVTKSVNYSVLYMKAVKALQEAMERIEQLEQRITAAGID